MNADDETKAPGAEPGAGRTKQFVGGALAIAISAVSRLREGMAIRKMDE